MEVALPKAQRCKLWQFANAELDERTRELRVNGEPVALESKPLAVLFHLLHHAGEVVTKDELAEACWPRRIMSESVLAKAIGRLREVLEDENQTVIRTIHGYGYRLAAPVRVLAVNSSTTARHFAFKVGDRPPGRPLWTFLECLGSGRSGEVWLARHDKTHERRVYKFPLDVLALGSLKREITLSRLLAQIGDGRIARVIDWNLDEEPYFIESEFASGGNLMQWAESQGGLDKIPITKRIELMAEVAEALAAAHAIGVLHKDLKPANVLVECSGGLPRTMLADFGSGGVLDPERLEALGITRLGFTRTLAANDASSGTPLYLAPEILSGQPATVQADIYSLGIMLYQIAIGDFRKSLAPGWELEIDDELLREDISAAAAGDPRRRLTDGAVLARRLRTLNERRTERERELASSARMALDLQNLDQIRRRRKWVIATVAALVVGSAFSLVMWIDAKRARDEATRAATASKTVADFLSKDLFENVASGERPPREWTVEQLLQAASRQIEERFSAHPDVAQEIHGALSGAYLNLELVPQARSHGQRAYRLAVERFGDGSVNTARSAQRMVILDYLAGKLRESLNEYQQVLNAAEKVHGKNHPDIRGMRRQLIWGHNMLGEWQKAHDLARADLADVMADTTAGHRERAAVERSLGNTLQLLGRYLEAERTFRSALAHSESQSGEDGLLRLSLHINLIQPLIAMGRYAEAEAELVIAEQLAVRWAPSMDSSLLTVIKLQRGTLLLEQGKPDLAIPVLEAGLRDESATSGQGIDQSAILREPLAFALLQTGRTAEAATMMRQALNITIATSGELHPECLRRRIGLAEILLAQRRPDQAAQVLSEARVEAMDSLPITHPIRIEYGRLRALLDLGNGKTSSALNALREAAQAYALSLGQDHWKARRAHAELAAAEG